MDTDDSRATDGRSRARIALVVGCVLAAVLAAALVPTLASDNLAGTPIDSVLPGERFDDTNGGGAGGSGSGFGALNPGDRTGVGGDTGFDSDTFGSNDTEVHFVVESTETAYWRTGSYDTYTGTGWERDGGVDSYDPPLAPVGLTDGELEFEIALESSATAIPTAWQPRQVSGVDGLQVTESGALLSDEPVAPGTTVTGVSQVQANDVDLLRSAGEDYPDELAERYTQLPDDTPDRIAEFTDELTEDDETPYDTAVTIQNWLRSEKGYSLQANETGDDVAETFIFEMDEGYCEYFATAMTTMLRTQDVPARYTVGYTPGQPVGDDTYEVRGMNAHAWVEVYFPEVGWVQFEPTPGDSRLAAESAALEDQLGEELDTQEPGSPGEVFEPGNVTGESENGDETTDGYDISLNRTTVPGMAVEIEVTDDGEPAGGMVVTVNGEEVGTTDSDGTVVITVPNEDELDIEVSPVTIEIDDEWSEERNESQSLTGEAYESQSLTRETGESRPSASLLSGTDGRLYSPVFARGADINTRLTGSSRSVRGWSASSQFASEGDNETVNDGITVPVSPVVANTTVPVETDATVTVTGDALPGETVVISAAVQEVPIAGATVTVDGEQVATTDENGRANATLPEESGDVTVEIERDAVFGEETVTLPSLDLAVDTGRLSLPFTTASVTVSAGDRDVANATVAVNGEQVATSGADGTADVRLPFSSAATIEANTHGLSDTQTVGGLLWNLGLVGLGVVAVLTLAAGAVHRLRQTPGTLVGRILAGVRNVPRFLQLLLLAAVRDGSEWVNAAAARVQMTVVYGFDVLRGRLEPAEVRTLLVTWLRAKRRALHGLVSADDSSELERDVARGIQRAWGRFLSHVSVHDPSVQTPGELAAHAIEVDGLPADAVTTLLTAFREIEYGKRPEQDRLLSVEAAIEEIERHTVSSDDESRDDGTRRHGHSERAATDGGVE